MKYNQCRLDRSNDDGSKVTTVSWIPSRYAKLGKSLMLREQDGSWSYGWKVMSVGEPREGVPKRVTLPSLPPESKNDIG